MAGSECIERDGTPGGQVTSVNLEWQLTVLQLDPRRDFAAAQHNGNSLAANARHT
jgi:hypothetical protein